MTKDKVLEYIDTVIRDCDDAVEIIETEGRLEWDANCYYAMAEILIKVREYIREKV
ncbi:MAG: hypothetical protein PHY47_01200 [Lachnospiraceae bacterium]|nr:hypothetical protein [Lachnospiraceae bacterium]